MSVLVPSPTERLTYRRCKLEDAAFILELLNSPGWLKYIGDRGVYSLADAEDYIRNRLLKGYDTPGCGPNLLCRKSDGILIGTVGVYSRPGLDIPDFGFALLPAFHGQGYGYEASLSCLEFAVASGQEKLSAITLPTNEASLGLLTKLGFERTGESVVLPGEDVALLLLHWEKDGD
jgi:RimJ/RimL family protein N-acetyltransferase